MKRLLALAALASLAAAPVHADTWKDLKNSAKQQASDKAAEQMGIATPAPANAKVYIIEPKDGATVSSPVKVVFGLSGAGVSPAGYNKEGTGHHHLLIDNPTIDYTQALPATDQIKHFGGGQTETMLDLKPGKHTLQLLFADWKHQPFNPSVQSDVITITVK
ncbi:DUF4399 domain-containing protein [Solimonas terrae]|uniref:DUF4399 domain-containing protein n=1 Tax=Solimonas terrae TaxID=1396819 RepID=A0A6M2BS38_9GAMM|nr:DUF4399 domain-containing protein [Solimonas terrae]NGY05442.1 DUF4399 domain-containing protein [Solimonas terrae]